MRVARRIALRIALGVAVLGALVVAGDRAWDRYLDARYDALASELADLADLPADDGERAADMAREFVLAHSVAKMDDWFWANWRDREKLASTMLAHAKGAGTEPPHLECSTRSGIMSAMLRSRGYEVRRIDAYTAKDLESHSFIEVRDPKTGRWHAEDPLYGIYWRRIDTKERVTISSDGDDLTKIEPCGRSGCGWDSAEARGAKAAAKRFDLIAVRYSDGPRFTVYTSRAGADDVARYCKKVGKNCRDGIRPISASDLP